MHENRPPERQLEELKQELSASAARFRNIIARSADGIVIVDGEGVIRFFNPAAERLFGRRSAEVEGASFGYPVVAGETSELDIVSHPHFCQDPSRRRTIIVEMRAVETEWEGEPACLATLRDITERRTAEQELRKLNRAIQQSPSIVMITDREGGIEYVNPKFTEITGYAANEASGQNPRLLKSGLLADETYRDLWQTISSGGVWRGELINRKKNRELYWESASISPVRDNDGAITHYVAVKEDITDRKRAEEALRESEERYSTIFENNHAVMLLIEPESGTIVDANPAACTFYGYAREELQSRTIFTLNVMPADALHALMMKARETNSSRYNFHHRLAGGEVRDVEVYSGPIVLKGRRLLFSIIHDVTDRIRAEEEVRTLNRTLTFRAAQLEATNRELEAFSYTVSHDLRTPLTVINGVSQLLKEKYRGHFDEEGAGFLELIADEVQRMDQLVDTMLSFAQVTLSELTKGTVDLSQIARTLAVKFRFREPERRVTFTIQDGVTVQGDENLLHIVLENLLGNAWKYTGNNDVTEIEFGVKQNEGELEAVYFVRDNGVGFEMAEADRLFGTFQRLQSGSGFEGTGIGLATVKRIIARHGGRIWAEGEPGRGAAFFFTL